MPAPADRITWFRHARFGMFIHWGLYARLGRWEWTMHNEQIPLAEYARLASDWKPEPDAARSWARLARKAGMKYMVLTTKHHDGYCLWDSDACAFNAKRTGPGRDLVREYVEAARAEGLGVGLYYSLMDWRHPDGWRCSEDPAAQQRFVDYTFACVRELCSRYGTIDLLWYDNAWPQMPGDGWKPAELNAMVRSLQPGILINNRSGTPEDFGTPEGHITPEPGRLWEACMTMNGAWGYVPVPDEDWVGTRKIIDMLRQVRAGGGNLLLNVGPQPDGRIPPQAVERLERVGRWLERNSEAFYGEPEPNANGLSLLNVGEWTMRGNTAWLWCQRFPSSGTIAIGGWRTPVESVTLVGTNQRFKARQDGPRLLIEGLPTVNPDPIAQVPVLRLDCSAPPCVESTWRYLDPTTWKA